MRVKCHTFAMQLLAILSDSKCVYPSVESEGLTWGADYTAFYI
jgi:hypothetical protein